MNKSVYLSEEQKVREFRKILFIGIGLVVLLLLFFSYLAKEILSTEKLVFDMVIIDWVQSFVSDALTPIARGITEVGYIYVMIPVMLVALYILIIRKKHFWEGVMLIMSLGGGDVIKKILKETIQRDRPSIMPLIHESGFSFPSGHSMASVTFYGMLAYILWINLPNRKGLRTLIVFAAVILILAIGTSRIYLGVHFPSDVVGGYVVGSVWLITCILALHAIRYYKSDRKRGYGHSTY